MALVTLKRQFWALKLLVLIFRSLSKKIQVKNAMGSIFKIDLNVKNRPELPSPTAFFCPSRVFFFPTPQSIFAH